ncbi:MAG: hypothetical protein ACI8PZ_007413 [Myxococcota bacterium]|jgi:hypothetical protein
MMLVTAGLGAVLMFSNAVFAGPGYVPSARVVDTSSWAMVGGARAVAWADDGETHHGWVPEHWEAIDAAPMCDGAVVLRYSERKATVALDVYHSDDDPIALWSVKGRSRADVLLAFGKEGTWLIDAAAEQLLRVRCDEVTHVAALSAPEHTCSRAGRPIGCPASPAPVGAHPALRPRRRDDTSSVHLGYASEAFVWWGSRRSGMAQLHEVDIATGDQRVVRLLHVQPGGGENPTSVSRDGTRWVEQERGLWSEVQTVFGADETPRYGLWSKGSLYGFVGVQLVRFDPDGHGDWCVAKTWRTSSRLARPSLRRLVWVLESPEGGLQLGTADFLGLIHAVQGGSGLWAPAHPPEVMAKRLDLQPEAGWFSIESTPPTPQLGNPLCVAP